ncbi:MAG: hypothetical protein A3A80_03480 [Candidatus Terrybacteria bacterium RIFCSPLOWO2_01_FULL_44_24]|uniref:Uncharacterized protein n=1 Tax=Candidatus Terrybacteria bacterium RIFCSPHIGHO2_01_FULL_43_35 TaxID=1802361 RepID=A0A1G2PDJ5_9BACT|nr:MAG: hypothetical protein A2828_00400 [Candidatus Terrybacteria bacterium RIFCSPHIGHO2_01_FULL_43_35]OHA49746.1 MAG: hypothetical protein A3B75_01975 [Candidatus Terrybacteria bacterium RIFCSPHIGHO2_02_FULL_43_14]OHA51568.1 MAG: hypothetical protein A3A80_03480 [Candidatus Terrybacteria bacterium RIFCSPLOWO2_01_FULL_44_24]
MLALNIGSQSEDWRARLLSNFAGTPFIIDDHHMASVEGFIQGIKYPEDHPNRARAFASDGYEAKRYGFKWSLVKIQKTSLAGRSMLGKVQRQTKFVWWNGVAIPYGSAEHHALIERATREKFNQNPEATEALLATGTLTITHDLGRPESPHTSLPAAIFCDILTKIRQEAAGS